MSTPLLLLWLSLSAAPQLDSNGCTPLQAAVIRSDERAVWRLAGRRLLGMMPPSVNLEETGTRAGRCRDRTALMLAAEAGELQSARILISSGADLTAEAVLEELGDEPLDAFCLAQLYGHQEVVSLLNRARARSRSCSQNALLFRALTGGSAEAIELQLRAHPSPKTLRAALSFVLPKDNPKAVELLLAAAEQPAYAELYRAALVAGQTEIVGVLTSHGAKLLGGEELALALELNRWEAIPLLIKAGADTGTPEVRAAVLTAVRRRQGASLNCLLEAGYRGDPEIPLMLHAVRHFPSLVPELVKAGVEVEIDDESGTTALMAAASAANDELVTLLISRGASMRTADVLCETALGEEPPPLPVPGRAARRLGITCGAARLSVSYPPGLEVFLPHAVDPMRPAMEHRLKPGPLQLRVRDSRTGEEREVAITLQPGLNTRDLDAAR